MALRGGRYLTQSASHRLAFRELGLAIGLRALPIITDVTNKYTIENRSLRRAAGLLQQYETFAEEIVSAWLPHAKKPDASWQAHRDINDVMLATALIPEAFLSIDERGMTPGAVLAKR